MNSLSLSLNVNTDDLSQSASSPRLGRKDFFLYSNLKESHPHSAIYDALTYEKSGPVYSKGIRSVVGRLQEALGRVLGPDEVTRLILDLFDQWAEYEALVLARGEEDDNARFMGDRLLSALDEESSILFIPRAAIAKNIGCEIERLQPRTLDLSGYERKYADPSLCIYELTQQIFERLAGAE